MMDTTKIIRLSGRENEIQLGLLLKIVFDILVINGKTVNPPIQIFHLESILAKIFFYGEGVVG